ncbi:MAG TPA: lantibiotic dehydratase C-terminal domain-containing protein, partial [Ktedonobacteraceae bacterium]|nr:lantibiotic dehydratase C-terminal domain-containing protein [Ktedonobacteraceae bacterium]
PRMALKRVLLSLHLMQTVVDTVFASPGEREQFLEHYRWYWSGQGKKGAENLRDVFIQSARLRRDVLIGQLSDDLKDPLVQKIVANYRSTVTEVVQDLHDALDELTESINHMCFDYVHMNNNRLGIVPLEESYMSALLLEINHTAAAHAMAALQSWKEELYVASKP